MSNEPETGSAANPENQSVEGGPACVGLPSASPEDSAPGAKYPFGFAIDEMDTEAFFNMRDWLQKACETAGGKMTGGGIGMGQADIDIELEGCRYNISIKPLAR